MFTRGFTLLETIVTIALLSSLFVFASVNLLSTQHRSSLSSAVTTLVSDLNATRLKAMSGAAPDSFGVYFDSDSYTLFQGSVYSPSDPLNAVIDPGQDLEFTAVTFPDSVIVFARGSGEIVGFTPGSNTFSLVHTAAGLTKAFTLNRYGIVTQID